MSIENMIQFTKIYTQLPKKFPLCKARADGLSPLPSLPLSQAVWAPPAAQQMRSCPEGARVRRDRESS